MKYLLPGFAVLLLCFQSCQSKPTENEEEPGKITASVICKTDTSVSYALYLPRTNTASLKKALLLCFDSHGTGLLPVELFKDDAEKNGFIVAGSNNSKNGLPGGTTNAIAEKTLSDIKTRFNIDEKRIYVCGFSGGARVAGGYAMTHSGVAGIVACGAGLPNSEQQVIEPFSFLGIAGNEDFNCSELRLLDDQLEKAGYDHCLLVFDGIHQWPPKTLVPEIFQWLQLDGMRHLSLKKDLPFIGRFVAANDSLASALEKEQRVSEQLAVYSKMFHFLKGVVAVNALQERIAALERNKGVIQQKSRDMALLDHEMALQQMYSRDFQEKELPFWEKETSKLMKLSEQSSLAGERQMYKRVLGSLSLQAYMYSTNLLKQGNLPAAAKFIAIYGIVDPQNPEHFVLAADLELRQGKTDTAFTQLEKAIGTGFKDKQRLITDPAFATLQSDKRFQKLVAGL